MLKFPHEYQAHLERISDFLLPGEGVWWSRDLRGVVFHDGEGETDYRSEGPTLHHYRHSTIKQEQSYLWNCWEKCLHDDVTIPHVILATTVILGDGSRVEVDKETTYVYDDQSDEEMTMPHEEATTAPVNDDGDDDDDDNVDDYDGNGDGDGDRGNNDKEIGFVLTDQTQSSTSDDNQPEGENTRRCHQLNSTSG